MGKINVKGLGVVEIEGDKPTQQEADDIKKALTTLNVDGISNAVGDEEAQKYSEGSSFGRILTEVGGSILGSIAGGGFTLPGLVRQVGMRSMPFIKALAITSEVILPWEPSSLSSPLVTPNSLANIVSNGGMFSEILLNSSPCNLPDANACDNWRIPEDAWTAPTPAIPITLLTFSVICNSSEFFNPKLDAWSASFW